MKTSRLTLTHILPELTLWSGNPDSNLVNGSRRPAASEMYESSGGYVQPTTEIAFAIQARNSPK